MTVRERSALSRFFRDDRGRVVVAQLPNPPLLVWLGCTLARLLLDPSGWVGPALSALGTAALLVWSALEIRSGASPFRRALGAVVLAGVLVRLALSV